MKSWYCSYINDMYIRFDLKHLIRNYNDNLIK